jgi:hypothetical protein
MITSTPTTFVRELNFKTIKEDWLVYKLKDGSIIKIKPVLVKIFEINQIDPITGKNMLYFITQNILDVKSPDDLKGPPDPLLPSLEEMKKLDKKEVEIEEVIGEEGWNLYELEDGRVVKTKTIVIHIYRINGRYDWLGNPWYYVQTQIVGG